MVAMIELVVFRTGSGRTVDRAVRARRTPYFTREQLSARTARRRSVVGQRSVRRHCVRRSMPVRVSSRQPGALPWPFV